MKTNLEILLKLKNEHPEFYQALTDQMHGGACPWAFGLREKGCNSRIKCGECWQQAMAEPQFPVSVRAAMLQTFCRRRYDDR